MNDNSPEVRSKSTTYFSQTRQEMMKYIPRGAKKILDVGCGEGNFGSQLKNKLQAEVWGIEVESQPAKIAHTKIDKVLIGDVGQVFNAVPSGYFDCIIFNDVIEHLVDPYSILLRVKEKLNNKGVIVCSIPNVRYFFNLREILWYKQWRYTEWGILDKTHLRFFTLKSIRDMFNALGYEEILIEGINPITSWKFNVVNLFSLGHLSDTRYWRFACVEKPKS